MGPLAGIGSQFPALLAALILATDRKINAATDAIDPPAKPGLRAIGLALGEQVALALLRELRVPAGTFRDGFSLTRFDGTRVLV